MTKRSFFSGLSVCLAAFFLLLMTACGDSGTEETTDTKVTNDEEAVTDTVSADQTVVDEIADEDTAEEQLPEYPTETASSIQVNDIAANMVFYDHTDKKWTMGHFYQKKKLIWLILSAYDCPYCNQEKKVLPSLNKEEYVTQGFQMIFIENGLLSGPQPDKEPNKINNIRTAMVDTYGDTADFIYGYVQTADQGKLSKYVDQGYPVNVLIDGSTMKVLKHFEGWDDSMTNSMDKTVEFFLSDL